MRTCGSYWSSRLHGTVASAASATPVWMFALVVASSASAGPVRATATTGAPASANARAVSRPRPRLTPATTVVLPGRSLVIVLVLCVSMVSLAVVVVVAAPPEAGLVAAEWRAVEPLVRCPVRSDDARCELVEPGTVLTGWRPEVRRAEVVLDGSRLPLLLGDRRLE